MWFIWCFLVFCSFSWAPETISRLFHQGLWNTVLCEREKHKCYTTTRWCLCCTCLWSLTALVERVEPGNVIPTHFLSITKRNIGIGDRNHGGLAILGESISAIERTWLHKGIIFQIRRHFNRLKWHLFPTCGTAWLSCNHKECLDWVSQSSWSCVPFLQ